MSLPHTPNEPSRTDSGLADAKTILTVLEGFTEGIILCEPLRGAVKVAKEIVDMVQVSYHPQSVVVIRAKIIYLVESPQESRRLHRTCAAHLCPDP
jgi:hypothetical protein